MYGSDFLFGGDGGTSDGDDDGITSFEFSCGNTVLRYHLAFTAPGHGDSLWNASRCIAEKLLMDEVPEISSSTTLSALEFGAGGGLPSLALIAQNKVPFVVVTDRQARHNDDNLCALKRSVEANLPEDSSSYKPLVEAHSWGEDIIGLQQKVGRSHFDLLIACDCIYNPQYHGALLDSASSLLEPEAGVWIVGYSFHGNVFDHEVLHFFAEAQKRGFCILREFSQSYEGQEGIGGTDPRRGAVHVKILTLRDPNICRKVRRTCREWVEGEGLSYVRVNVNEDAPLVSQIQKVAWDDDEWHYSSPKHWPENIRRERLALYILCIDAINFCFWPLPGYEYDRLAVTLTAMAEADHALQEQDLSQVASDFVMSPSNLAQLEEKTLAHLFQKHASDSEVRLSTPPNLESRCNLLVQVGKVLLKDFCGSAWNMIEAADGSAVRLVQIIFDHLEGFRDLSDNQDVFFLKRAQICVGDWNAALELNLEDIDELTTFADYRVPQILRHHGWLTYSPALSESIDQEHEIERNSNEELSIRAATVVAVEELTRILNQRGGQWNDVRVDWYLW